MNWQTTYPTMATVMEAGFETLCTWHESLPDPQNDVERSVRRRVQARRTELGARLMSARHPDIVDQFKTMADKLGKAGIKVPELDDFMRGVQ